jgi:hypothetical protein
MEGGWPYIYIIRLQVIDSENDHRRDDVHVESAGPDDGHWPFGQTRGREILDMDVAGVFVLWLLRWAMAAQFCLGIYCNPLINQLVS